VRVAIGVSVSTRSSAGPARCAMHPSRMLAVMVVLVYCVATLESASVSQRLQVEANAATSSLQSPNLGDPMFVVPVMEPETQMNMFSALNPTPDLPALLAPGTNMGTRPFYAMPGIGVVAGGSGGKGSSFLFKQLHRGQKPHQIAKARVARFRRSPSLLETESEASEGSDCPKGWSLRATSSDEQPRCMPDLQRPIFVVPMPKFSPAVWNPIFPGYNPALPPVSMPGAVPGVAQPALAIVPKKGKAKAAGKKK